MSQVKLSPRRRKKVGKRRKVSQSRDCRPWTDESFEQSRKHLRTRIATRHWQAKPYWQFDPFGDSDMVGFMSLTVTIDKALKKVCKRGRYSSDDLIRRFSYSMDKLDIPGVCYFDVGSNSNPHMHCLLAVGSEDAYLRLTDSFNSIRANFGHHLELTKLESDIDVGRWITYSEKRRPWHGNFPDDMEPNFSRFRGMATTFCLNALPEVVSESIEFDDIEVDVVAPKYVEGSKLTIPVADVAADLTCSTPDDRFAFILHYARKGLPDMIGAAASLVRGKTVESFVRMDRLSDEWVIDLVAREYTSNPEKAARILHNQLFEFRKERIYLSALSAKKIGSAVRYIVNGDKVSPGLDRSLYSANLRAL